jgi:hypothetical protein
MSIALGVMVRGNNGKSVQRICNLYKSGVFFLKLQAPRRRDLC